MKEKESWKVGELAKRTGLTVRTLHHYDEIGLLSPSHRTPSGHRQYGEADVVRLQQVVSLRSLGFPLEEIREVLERPDTSPASVLRLHVGRVRTQVEEQRRLAERLEGLAEHMESSGAVSVDELFETMEMIQMFEKYYTPEQLQQLEERRKTVGEERMREVQEEWPRLIAEVKAEMDKGTDPSDPRVRELARRWQGLIDEFTGGDPGIARSLSNLYQNEPAMRERAGFDPAVAEYVRRAGVGG